MVDRFVHLGGTSGHGCGGMARPGAGAPAARRTPRGLVCDCSPQTTSEAHALAALGDVEVRGRRHRQARHDRPLARRRRPRRRPHPHSRRHPPDDHVGDFFEVNTNGTRHVAEAALEHGVRRMVHVSSNSPFGTNPHPSDTFRADEPYHPYFGYGRSKMQAELAVFAAIEPRSRCHDRAPTVVLRAVPTAAADDVLPHGARRQVPGRRRRHAATIDGLRRQPRRRCDRSRAHPRCQGQGLLDRRRAAVHGQRDRRRPSAARWPTKGSA